MAFLKQEYKFLAIFMVVFAAIIAVLIDDSHTGLPRGDLYCDRVSVRGSNLYCVRLYRHDGRHTSNARTTAAAKRISPAFDMAINAGAAMGFALVASPRSGW